jgi:hypothetical protein
LLALALLEPALGVGAWLLLIRPVAAKTSL